MRTLPWLACAACLLGTLLCWLSPSERVALWGCLPLTLACVAAAVALWIGDVREGAES